MWTAWSYRAFVPFLWYWWWDELRIPGAPSGQAQHIYLTTHHLFQVSGAKPSRQVKFIHFVLLLDAYAVKGIVSLTLPALSPLVWGRAKFVTSATRKGM
jgi:hypothetical protein